MKHSPLIQRHACFVLLIDIQQKLAPAIAESESVIERNQWLLNIAHELSVPVVATEQYPSGLGHTVAALEEQMKQAIVYEKLHFSAFQEKSIADALVGLNRPQVIITGTETHVCVLQTALDMQEAGLQVFVVEDAVGSRRELNKQLALQRMQQAGCVIVSSEMVAFEWLQRCATDEFRHISKTYIR
ncbi:hydrolase [Aliidiomarina minuta]|uniref:Hydrolase n=1 Tax=Aliidiomarina minuta TaxID=880057 RepID=A0A432WA60_9GAMM|nr:hydrolase [Aliidiomarina minuta]RUO26931.1 hydrolase [Aliidiomarina minuta]